MTVASVPETFAETMAAIEREELPPNLGTLLDDAAARFGDRPLWVPIQEPGAALSFSAFAEWTGRCVSFLESWGVGPGSHVAVMLPNVAAFPITWLAIARLGAVLVPVNNHNTAHELAQVLDASDAEFLVIDRAQLGVFSEIPAGKLRIGPGRVAVHGGSATGGELDWLTSVAPAPVAVGRGRDIDPDRLLSIQFTSGSTGLPKGCMLSQRYWVTIGRVRAAHGLPSERFLADMPLHYMGGQWRFLMALWSGATAFVAGRPSLSQFLDRLLSQGLQFCVVNNAMAKLPHDPRYAGLNLRWVGSVALQKELQEPFERRLGAPIRELYGTTETGSTLHVPAAATEMVGSGACGLPVAFRECMVAGPGGEPLPAGETGELWVAGPDILHGYYKRPDADAQVRRGRWFRTGDLARQDRDGYFYIAGRIKDVIRRAGENIAAAEVEAALNAMPEVLEAAAVPVPDTVRGEEVKVYIALSPGLLPAELPPDRILEHCRTRLARFKLPRYLEFVDRMPRTGSDKIAKPELIARRADLREGSFDFVDGIWRQPR
ncbi:class I adenylate-forming enzyme family protein [Candidatus Nephthysia bennettiae]|uniref:Acyl--CoA ligase n=1 Tax=Candidatus Nephthysia bennettiae TaxID=3127016 RepID=A0A934N9N9_9BACT|nr:acyl--CoA ligase [Candidatus Dormibacteraeota bacterium]MBJ7612415.1 acyl--CoA ligase [Candidatus Dormibacteraeota bacterium]